MTATHLFVAFIPVPLALVGALGSGAGASLAGSHDVLEQLARLDMAPAPSGLFGLLPLDENGCPTCSEKTPALNNPVQLVIPPVAPSTQPANSGFTIEFQLRGAPVPGECEEDDAPASDTCEDKPCKFTLVYKVAGPPSGSGSYGYSIKSTFPASNPANSGQTIHGPGSPAHTAEWKDLSFPCSDDGPYDIQFDWFTWPGDPVSRFVTTSTETYTLGCKGCGEE